MRSHLRRSAMIAALVLALTGCEEPTGVSSVALSTPVDFSFACAGPSGTGMPAIDEGALSITDGAVCPAGSVPLGLILNQQPGSVSIIEMSFNTAVAKGTILDLDRFVPGVTSLKVGDLPIRLLRAPRWDGFYAVSAGDRDVTYLRVWDAASGDAETSAQRFDLPGTPADAQMLGDSTPDPADDFLVVAAAHTPTLWRYAVGVDAANPPREDIPVTGIVERLVVLDGGHLLVSWSNRPVISILTLDGSLVAEAGLGAACADTLDNDGDGQTDGGDPGCHDPSDTDEAGADAWPDESLEPIASFEATVFSCQDGLDNDDDGFTDWPFDPGCDDAKDDESTPACADGVDNDGDGWVDTEDPGCYGPSHDNEGPPTGRGPFIPALVPAGDAGTFVYVLEQSSATVHVLEVGTDPADGALNLAAVAIHADDTTVPRLFYRPYALGDPQDAGTLEGLQASLPAIRVAAAPQLHQQGVHGIALPQPVHGLHAGQLRGELWTRIIPAAEGEAPALAYGINDAWSPAGCALGGGSLCAQPPGDDQTWVVLAPRVDGGVQVLEAVRRGVPVHRLSPSFPDPGDRGFDASKPQLSVKGLSISVGESLREGFPFPGPRLEETLPTTPPETEGAACDEDTECVGGACECTDDACAEKVCVSDAQPRLFRHYGVWPPEDLEQVLDETWAVTYEGSLPATRSHQGRLTSETTLYDPQARFCDAGVTPGDWLVIDAPWDALSSDLHHEVTVTIEHDGEDRECALLAPLAQTLEVQIVAVGRTELTLDPASLRLRPVVPLLDEDLIRADPETSWTACEDAMEALLLQLDDHVTTAGADLDPAQLPGRLRYHARADAAWVVVGSQSGHLHPMTWDDAEGRCEATGEGPAHTGRFQTASPLLEAEDDSQPPAIYATCMPPTDTLKLDAYEALIDVSARFQGVGFRMDMFPACQSVVNDEGKTVAAAVATQRDTQWVFSVAGPDGGRVIGPDTGQLTTTIPYLPSLRRAVYLDAASQRVFLWRVEAEADGIFSPVYQ